MGQGEGGGGGRVRVRVRVRVLEFSSSSGKHNSCTPSYLLEDSESVLMFNGTCSQYTYTYDVMTEKY